MTDNNSRNLGSDAVSIWPTVLKYGLVIAAFRVVYNLLLYATGLAGTTGLGLVGIVGAIALLVVALKRFRSLNTGYATFGQAFGIGLFTSVISTVVRASVDFVYLATAGSAFLAAQREATLDRMAGSPGMDPQAMEMMTGFFNSLFTPGGLFMAAIVTGVIGWIILSLIVAAVMKNPPPITD